MTKGLDKWNKKNFNRWGINAMYSADGFVKSIWRNLTHDSKLMTKLYLLPTVC